VDLLAPFLPRREVAVTALSPAISPRTSLSFADAAPPLADAAQLTGGGPGRRLEWREKGMGEGGRRRRREKSVRAHRWHR
jgi:hypothetical protein